MCLLFNKFSKCFFAGIAAFIFSANLKAEPMKAVEINKTKYLLLKDIAKELKFDFKQGKKRTTLSKGKTKVVLYPRSDQFHINGIRIDLLSPTLTQDGKHYISRKDYQFSLVPLFKPETLKKHEVKLIVIDPGHGGKETGCQTKKNKEKDVNMVYSKDVVAALKKMGYKVIMTRNDDSYVSLIGRAKFTQKMKGDIFVSIHQNYFSREGAEGFEVFAMAPCNTPKNRYKKPSPGNIHNLNNKALAYAIQKRAIPATKAYDRGVKHARFSVLRNNSCPAVLIECGFLSNHKEEKKLTSAKYRAKIVKAIAEGIDEYIKMVKPVTKKK